jgi:hypothetical protein
VLFLSLTYFSFQPWNSHPLLIFSFLTLENSCRALVWMQQIPLETNTTFSCKVWYITMGYWYDWTDWNGGKKHTNISGNQIYRWHRSLLSVCGATLWLLPRKLWFLCVSAVLHTWTFILYSPT